MWDEILWDDALWDGGVVEPPPPPATGALTLSLTVDPHPLLVLSID